MDITHYLKSLRKVDFLYKVLLTSSQRKLFHLFKKNVLLDKVPKQPVEKIKKLKKLKTAFGAVKLKEHELDDAILGKVIEDY